MEPIKFKGHNVVFAEDQPEYLPLPAYYVVPDNPQGEIITCWKLTFKERVRLLFTGKVWHSIWTFNGSLQPQRLFLEAPKFPKGKTK